MLANFALLLEKAGGWRWLAVALVLTLCSLPFLHFGFSSLSGDLDEGLRQFFTKPFQAACLRSLLLIVWSCGLGLAFGWPLGAVAGTFSRLKSTYGALVLMLPLVMPPFLWAVGWSNLQAGLPFRYRAWLDGMPGSVLASFTYVLPLVLCGTLLASRSSTRSQRDSALLVNGPSGLFRLTVRHALPSALACALIGSLHVVADSGIAQIMGYHGIASELLIAFAARYDLGEVAAKSLLGVLLYLPFVTVGGTCLVRWMGAERLGGEAPADSSVRLSRLGRMLVRMAWLPAAAVVCAPICGLLLPVARGMVASEELHAALVVASETVGNTLAWSVGAGVVSVALGFCLALAAGRTAYLQTLVTVWACAACALPGSLTALGLILLAAKSPPELQALLRSPWIVPLGLGLRFVPLAAIFGLIAWREMPPTRHLAAGLHGVSVGRFLSRVLAPALAPWAAVAGLLVGLLCLSDTTSLVLLQPPGATTYAGRIFAMMDNASAGLTAALCLFYLATVTFGLLLLAVVALAVEKSSTKHR